MSRRRGLGIALAATLAATAAVAWLPEDAEPVAGVAPARRVAPPAAPQAARPAANPTPEDLTVERRAAWAEVEPPALRAWVPPAPPPVAAVVAAAPVRATVPTFPYRWIGRLEDGDAVTLLLSGPQRSVGVRAGDVLDGQWRVDGIAGTRAELTWLPGGDAVTLELR